MPGFARIEHIRRRADFERVYKTGSKRSGRLMTLFTLRLDRTTARLGIAATRKLGDAVARNRAKRLVRELFRLNKPTEGLDLVVVPRREMLDAPYARLEDEFLSLLRLARPTRPVSGRPGRTGADSRL